MSFVLVDMEQLESMTDLELMKYIESCESATGDFTVTNMGLDDELRVKKTIAFEDINQMIKYDNENGKYEAPYFDERELPIYKQKLNGGFKVPAKGFFWFVGAEVDQKALGIFIMNFKIGKLVRNDNDWRWEKEEKPDFEEEKIFYYDYIEQKFIQVFLDKDKKKKKKKDEEPEEESPREKYVKEYMKRLEMIDYIDERLALIEEKYSLKLHEFTKKFKRIRYHKTQNTAQNYRVLLGMFSRFNKYLVNFFPVKLTFKHIDVDEFVYLKSAMDELELKVDTEIDNVSDLIEKYKNRKMHLTQDSNSAEPDVRQVYKDSEKLVDEIIEILEPKVIKPFNFKKKETITRQGYYKYTTKRLYPSLGTIELRRSKTELPMKKMDWEKYEKVLLEKLISDDKSTGKEIEKHVSASRRFFKKFKKEELYDELVQLRETNVNAANTKFRDFVKLHGGDIPLLLKEFQKE